MTKPLLPRYILCQYVSMPNGKSNKIPLNPQTLYAQNPLDPAIHMNYDEACALAQKHGDSYGVGYVLRAEDKYFCLDLDNCITPEGKWNSTALKAMALFTTAYKEVSHSGKGLHIFGKYEGEEPIHGCRNTALGVEIYTDERFIAITGTNAVGDAQAIQTEQLTQFISDMGLERVSNAPTVSEEWTTQPCDGCKPPKDNLELIRVMLSKRLTKDEVFRGVLPLRDLWEENTGVLAERFPTKTPGEPYDRSSADAALAYRLHYFTGYNCERVKELMYLSGLKRDKWDNSPNYLPRTILYARGSKSVFCTHDGRSPQTPQGDNTPSGNNNQQYTTERLLQVQNYPELSARGKVLDTSVNLKTLLDVFDIKVRWNNMKREREISIPKCHLFPEDEENFALNVIKDLALNNEMPILRIEDHLNLLAQKENYHPIVEGLKKNPWDGIPRLREFIDTLETTNQTLTHKLVRRWMISAIAAAHSEQGFEAHGVLVLAGAQNLGKTRFIKALDPFNCNAIKSGALLDPKDKDCVKTMASFWIAELGELDGTFSKVDIARIKAFITERFDRIRFPYARKDSTLWRRTIYAATVNDPNYLVDDTGNRRWWTIHVLSINDKHGLDMTQVWAEVYSLWMSGEQTWMTPDEFNELNAHNKKHEQINPLEELLHTFFDFEENWKLKNKSPYSSTEVLKVLGFNTPSRSQCTQMGKILIRLTGELPKRGIISSFHQLVPLNKRSIS